MKDVVLTLIHADLHDRAGSGLETDHLVVPKPRWDNDGL